MGKTDIQLNAPFLLFCKTTPIESGISTSDNHINLKKLQDHLISCSVCRPHFHVITSKLLMSKDDIKKWAADYIKTENIKASAISDAAKDCRMFDDAELYNILLIFKTCLKPPFKLANLPYLFLDRLRREVPDYHIALLLDTHKDLVLHHRNSMGIVAKRKTNHAINMLVQIAISMLREGETIETITQETGIEKRSLYNYRTHLRKGHYD